LFTPYISKRQKKVNKSVQNKEISSEGVQTHSKKGGSIGYILPNGSVI